MKEKKDTKIVELTKGFSVVVDDNEIIRSYVDGRNYRYGMNPTNSSYFAYPFSVLGKDIVLRTVHEMIEKEKVLTESQKELLSRRIRSTNINYILLETILMAKDSLSLEQKQELNRGISEFEELMNSPL